jgi:hypothetical protein
MTLILAGKTNVVGAETLVRAPRTLADLVKIKSRNRVGVLEVQRRFPALLSGKQATTSSLARKASKLPVRLWALVPIYVTVQMLIRLRSWRLALEVVSYRWDRDDSSREPQ